VSRNLLAPQRAAKLRVRSVPARIVESISNGCSVDCFRLASVAAWMM
jgi:hypothetical protein